MNTTAATTTPSNYRSHGAPLHPARRISRGARGHHLSHGEDRDGGQAVVLALEGRGQRIAGADRARRRHGDGGARAGTALLHLHLGSGAAVPAGEPREVRAEAVDRAGCALRHRVSSDHELRDPAALGHRAWHLSTRAAPYPRVLAHRAGGFADGVFRHACVEGIRRADDTLAARCTNFMPSPNPATPTKSLFSCRPCGSRGLRSICHSRNSRRAFSARTPGARTSTRWARSPCSRSATRS